MDKDSRIREMMDKLQDDPYVRLPVDQQYNLDFEDVVVNDLDSYKQRLIGFKEDPEQKPLQLLIQFVYEVLSKDHFKILIDIIEFLSKKYENIKPNNPSYFIKITTVLEQILNNFLTDLQSDSEIRLETIQQANQFIQCFQDGGFQWHIHDNLKNFLKNYDKKSSIISIVKDKFNNLKKQFEQRVQDYKKVISINMQINKQQKIQKKEQRQIEIITAFREIKNNEQNEKDELIEDVQVQNESQRRILEPTDPNFEEKMAEKKIKYD